MLKIIDFSCHTKKILLSVRKFRYNRWDNIIVKQSGKSIDFKNEKSLFKKIKINEIYALNLKK